MDSLLYMNPDTTEAAAPPRHRRHRTPEVATATIEGMRGRARAILIRRGIDPDGIADQGDIAADLGLTDRRSVSWLRQQYKGPDGIRGKGLEPFPKPARVVGGGRGNPVWSPRWQPLAWHLTRPQTRIPEEDR